MSDTTTDPYAWHLAPVCDAFAPTRYPPPVTVNPDHVGYAVQRYLPGASTMVGEVIVGYHRLPEATAICALLNDKWLTHPQVANLQRRRTYL
jgi:hypothetical protein